MKLTPTFGFRETSRNARNFVKENMTAFWDIFKPLAVYIVVLTVIDLALTLFFVEPDPETGDREPIAIGGMIANYFYTCLVISWHRVVIHGPNQYEPMNPFKPKKSELAFIGVGLLIFFIPFLIGFAGAFGLSFLDQRMLLVGFGLIMLVLITFITVRLSFYFPAKATEQNLTLQKAFEVSKGYVLRLIAVPFLASIRVLLAMILFVVVIAVLGSMAFLSSSPEGSDIADIFGTILALPVLLYFQPIMTVLGVTVLSNYYLHAQKSYRAKPKRI